MIIQIAMRSSSSARPFTRSTQKLEKNRRFLTDSRPLSVMELQLSRIPKLRKWAARVIKVNGDLYGKRRDKYHKKRRVASFSSESSEECEE
jgi:hypothetical protein